MDELKYPGALGAAYWDKQKAALAKLKPTPIRAELDKLNRCYDIVDWTAFSTAKLDTAEQAEQRLVELDKEAKRTLKGLASQAEAVEKLAAKWDGEFGKDKQTPKEVLTALDTIEKAAKLLQSDIDVYVATARTEVSEVLAKLEAKDKKDAKGPGAETPAHKKLRETIRKRVIDSFRLVKYAKPNSKPILFMVAKGEEHWGAYVAPRVGPGHRAILKKLLDKDKTFKFFTGNVVWEERAYTFVGETVPGGMVKHLQKALLELTRSRYKVRVRKTSGEVEEAEGDDVPDAPPPVRASGNVAAEGVAFNTRLARLKGRIQGAMSGPDASDIKELIASITAQATAKDFGGASDDLDELEALLPEGAAAAPAAAPVSGGLSVKQLATARLEWGKQREHAVAEIKRLAQTLVREFQHESTQQDGVRKAVKQFQDLIDMLKTDLEQQLDAALGENDPARRARLAATAKQTLGRVRDLLDRDPVMQALDGNELIADMKVVEPMRKTLGAVEAALG